jgi:hypothetical protein
MKLLPGLLDFLTRRKRPMETVMGQCPGMVWDIDAKRWVDEGITWRPGKGRYAIVGPVYRPVGLQP